MQASFSDLEYDAKKCLTRRDRFLAEIEAVTPWTLLVAELEPFYPKGEGRGCPPIGLEKMLRMYIAQQCFGFSGNFTRRVFFSFTVNPSLSINLRIAAMACSPWPGLHRMTKSSA